MNTTQCDLLASLRYNWVRGKRILTLSKLPAGEQDEVWRNMWHFVDAGYIRFELVEYGKAELTFVAMDERTRMW